MVIDGQRVTSFGHPRFCSNLFRTPSGVQSLHRWFWSLARHGHRRLLPASQGRTTRDHHVRSTSAGLKVNNSLWTFDHCRVVFPSSSVSPPPTHLSFTSLLLLLVVSSSAPLLLTFSPSLDLSAAPPLPHPFPPLLHSSSPPLLSSSFFPLLPSSHPLHSPLLSSTLLSSPFLSSPLLSSPLLLFSPFLRSSSPSSPSLDQAQFP